MALVLADRVQETTNTTGTGTLTLAGAVSGYQTFASIGNANTTYYGIISGSSWEMGVGTYTLSGTTLSRDTVFSSSASGSKITVAAGAVVFCVYPSNKAVYRAANGDVILANQLGVGTTPDGSSWLQIAAGTTSVAPFELIAGALMTTPDDGSIEYDGEVFYGIPNSNNRGVMITEHFVARTGAKTMTSNTSLQSIFGGGTGGLTTGSLTVDSTETYFFECSLNVSSMSATNGNLGFSLSGGGTATFTSAAWHAFGMDATTQTTPGTGSAFFAATNANTGNIISGATGTAVSVYIKGIFRINAGGTIIPSIQLTTAAAAVIGADSWFKCYPVGADTAISIGNWA